MKELSFWLYLANAVTLIVHEIDSAYWKEWDLFHLPGGAPGFLLLHFPLLLVVLYGLVLMDRAAAGARVMAVGLGLAGIIAFSVHTFFLHRGRQEFRAPVSLGVLWGTLALSVAQLVVVLLGA